jgi:cytochrome c oxidase subunit 2
MAQVLPISPPVASTTAEAVDLVFGIELVCAAGVVILIAGTILYFSFRYRRRSNDETPARIGTHSGLEVLWTTATFVLFTFFFFLGAGLYVHLRKPLRNAQQVYVVGKQWMWKIQHADGLREINQLHVPVGQPTELVMTSEDVIHDFFIPAFRIKQDVIPGSYTSEWFTATEPGTYHLFCAQYCGTNHSEMVGTVVVLTPADYAAWRAGLGPAVPPADAGRELFSTYGCATCHGQTAPSLAGLYMNQVPLSDGTTVIADDDYLRTSIIDPGAQIVAGYPNIMPSYRGQLTPEQINALVEYVKILQVAKSSPTTRPGNESPLIHQLPNLPPAQVRPEVLPPGGPQ